MGLTVGGCAMGFQVADRWFERRTVDAATTLIWEPHVVPFLRCNIWHVKGRDRDLVIDTGMGLAPLRDFARDILGGAVSAVATHAHLDHIGGHHEFDHCFVHPLEAPGLAEAAPASTLAGGKFDPADLSTLADEIGGYDLAGPMVTAIPAAGFDLREYRIRPARNLTLIEDGDVIDLGDRHFQVFHLPGHSPGSIGLYEKASETLFSGDAVYDGPLLDSLAHSNVEDYIRTMERLMDLPVRVVHAGHDPSFGQDRLRELARDQLRRWRA